MARPADQERRERTLAAATEYVLEHGLADLSLRPLAAALGTSTRMLLYDFSSKEDLILAVLAETRRRESALLASYLEAASPPAAELMRTLWDWLASPERALADSLAGQADPGTATLVIAAMRGLILDHLLTGDRTRTDRALERFASLLEHDQEGQ